MDKFKLGELVWVSCSRSALDRGRLGIILGGHGHWRLKLWTVFIDGHHESHYEVYIRKANTND